MMNNFAVFILSHGRADTMTTFGALRTHGYSGQIYVVIDNEDDQQERYIERFGADNVLIFDKADYMDRFDAMDNFRKKSAVIYARLASQDMAKELGLEYYAQADDDINSFQIRYLRGTQLKGRKADRLDDVVPNMCKLLSIDKLDMLAFGTQNSVIGGAKGKWRNGLVWTCSNFFFLKTDTTIDWICRVNEDTCTGIAMAQAGRMNFSFTSVVIGIVDSGSGALAGGMQSAYDDGKWQHKYARIMLSPSSCKLRSVNGKLIHHTDAKKTFPMVLSERWKK